MRTVNSGHKIRISATRKQFFCTFEFGIYLKMCTQIPEKIVIKGAQTGQYKFTLLRTLDSDYKIYIFSTKKQFF